MSPYITRGQRKVFVTAKRRYSPPLRFDIKGELLLQSYPNNHSESNRKRLLHILYHIEPFSYPDINTNKYHIAARRPIKYSTEILPYHNIPVFMGRRCTMTTPSIGYGKGIRWSCIYWCGHGVKESESWNH